MGLIGRILGGAGGVAALGQAAEGMAQVFRPDATRAMELSAAAQQSAMSQLQAEYGVAGNSWFDRLVNGLNRLPRPFLAFGTFGLFFYAMIDPYGFGQRMVGLNMVPEPLWWLLGAIVAFYFGARETFYYRTRPSQQPLSEGQTTSFPDNAALHDWHRGL